jgi:hypothetical protein
MNLKTFFVILSFVATGHAFADYSLLSTTKRIECYGGEGQLFTLNRTRTQLKWSNEGETEGYQRVLSRRSDGRTFAEFRTAQVTLRLDQRGSSVYYFGERRSAESVTCE